MVISRTRWTGFANRRGVAAVEFGIVLIPLLLILFGIINWGVVIFNQSVITNAAREGARWAAIHNGGTVNCTNSNSATPGDACQVAYSYAYNNVISFSSSPSLTVSQVSNGNTTGTSQSVTVTYTYKGIVPYFAGNPDKNYTSTAVMLHE